MKTAVLYARVSTTDQSEYGRSIPTQLEACRDYARDHGWEVVDEITDDVSGAIPIDRRPGGSRLIERLREGIGAVVVYTQDRLSRESGALPYLLFKSTIVEYGAELHFTDTGHDSVSFESDLIGVIRAHAASEERKKIADRASRGRNAKAKAGLWVGNRPYGYVVNGTGREAVISVDRVTSHVVGEIFQMYIDGHSMAKIARHLNDNGIPSPTGRRWNDMSLWYILQNPIYKGSPAYNGITIPAPHLAIVDEETFDRAQDRRSRNRAHRRAHRVREYLLGGAVLRCSCERVMWPLYVESGGREYGYYVCSSRWERRPDCTGKSLRMESADRVVWSWASSLLSDDQILREGIQAMRERKSGTWDDRVRILNDLEQKAKEIDARITRLTRELSGTDSESLARVFRDELLKFGKERDWVGNEIERYRREMMESEFTEDDETALLMIARAIRTELPHLDLSTQKFVLDRLEFTGRLLEDGSLSVECSLGRGDLLPVSPDTTSHSWCNSKRITFQEILIL